MVWLLLKDFANDVFLDVLWEKVGGLERMIDPCQSGLVPKDIGNLP